MHKFLIITDCYPQPDKASGDLRFFTLLSLLARTHDVLYCALNTDGSAQPRNNDSARLEQVGVKIGEVNLLHALRAFKPDVVWFEFYHHVRPDYLALLKRYAPNARTVVDSVDVHFNRLQARAKLTRSIDDIDLAQQTKTAELAAYSQVDMVIAVSEDDRKLLEAELKAKPIAVIPNIHSIPPFPDPAKRRHGELVFVGSFKHHPNVDAMLYFCSEIMPLIKQKHPAARLKIIGSNPSPEILALACDHVEVVGYVPNVAPHLETAYISVAPLRYGGGMKGKVGEAMSYGLPVVTTSFGAEGFGLEVGRELLVADTPELFAAQVDRLLNDAALYEHVAESGYRFIESRYSVAAAEKKLAAAIDRLTRMPRPPRSRLRAFMGPLQRFYGRHIGWRLEQR